MILTALDKTLDLLYNTVMFLHKTPMTVTTGSVFFFGLFGF